MQLWRFLYWNLGVFQIWYFGVLHVVIDMSDTKNSANNKGSKRNLPSWMSSRDNEDENCGKKPTLEGEVRNPVKLRQPRRTESKQKMLENLLHLVWNLKASTSFWKV